MPITSIELSGCKRLMVKNITRIHMEFTERLQLILGTNGTGKSTIMRELTQLPADPDMYVNGGYKHLTHQLDDDQFVLRSVKTDGKMRHSFILNGQELNKDGLPTMQRKLAYEHFGVTPETHALVTDRERFSQMSPARRREWFTMLSDVSYDYALGLYKRLQDRAKEITILLKDAKKRLVIETARLISEEDQTRLQAQIEELHKSLDILQAERAPLIVDSHSLADRHEQLLVELNNLSDKTIRLRTLLFGKVDYESMELLDAFIEENKHQTTGNKALLDKAVKDHEKLATQYQILKKTGEQGLVVLKQKLEDKRGERLEILKQRRLGLEGIDPDLGLAALNTVRDVLTELFIALPENTGGRFSQAKFGEDRSALTDHLDNKRRYEYKVQQLQVEKKSMEAHKALGNQCCPKCGHTWIHGYSDERMEELEDKLEKMEAIVTTIDRTIANIQSRIHEFEEYRTQYQIFASTAKSWPVLMPFWDFLLESKVVMSSPRQAQAHVQTLEHDLKLGRTAKILDHEIDEMVKLIAQAETLGDENVQEVAKRLEESDEAIATLTAELTRLAEAYQRLVLMRRNLMDFMALGEKLAEISRAIEDLTAQRVEALRREIIHESIRQIQVQLANKTKLLSEVELQKRTVRDLEFNIQEMIVSEEAAKLLVAGLSPSEGLIAKGLLGSIQSFVAGMNQLIRQIWTYPLEVQPCGIDSDFGAELDYKFPVMTVGEHIEPSPDVKETSKGQQEIIDLAFRMTAMKKLGLQDPALMLDEFGLGLDETHRKSAANAIQSMIEQQLFHQVFMVSHYEAAYGALTQNEICVLCPDNITIPQGHLYNQHVTIEN